MQRRVFLFALGALALSGCGNIIGPDTHSDIDRARIDWLEQRPASYTFGNAPRTLSRARGPGLKNADVSMFKNVNIKAERGVYLQIRGEAFNVTNTPIFADPNVTVGSTSFGVITATQNSPRTLQVAMKLNF